MDGLSTGLLEDRVLLSLVFTSIPIPLVALVQPQGITTGPDGNLWFAEKGADRIGRMTPSGELTEFSLPEATAGSGDPAAVGRRSGPMAITTGSDGALWFVGHRGAVGRITTSGAVTEYPVPDLSGSDESPPDSPSQVIVTGPDGALWFTGVPGKIGRITTSGAVTEYPVPDIPTPGTTPDSWPTFSDIAVGPDGALWFAGLPGAIGRITTSGVVTKWPIPGEPPSAGSPPGAPAIVVTPRSIASGPDGALWFTSNSGKVGRITTSGEVSEFPLGVANATGGSSSSPPTPRAIVAGPDRALWMTTWRGEIDRMTTGGAVTRLTVPGDDSTLAGLAAGPNGNIWFTEQEDGYDQGQRPALGAITTAGVAALHNLPQGTTLNPNRCVLEYPSNIAAAPDGTLWFAERDALGRMTTDGAIHQQPFSNVNRIAAASDGAVWFNRMSPFGVHGMETYLIDRLAPDGTVLEHAFPDTSEISLITPGRRGTLWFVDEVTNPRTGSHKAFIGRMTPRGEIKRFRIPLQGNDRDGGPTAIGMGPDGCLYFVGGAYDKNNGADAYFGQVTPRGRVRLYALPDGLSPGAKSAGSVMSAYDEAQSLIAGPDGRLWFAAEKGQKSGIARISTDGKPVGFIPAEITGDLVRGTGGRVWFEASGRLGVATRSGKVATQKLPDDGTFPLGNGIGGLAFEKDGNLWYTDGLSGIGRVSGLDSVVGGLDVLHRPRHAPDLVASPYAPYSPSWTNVTVNHHPTFGGLARPGAEVTIWAEKQGTDQPIPIGEARARRGDGWWTLTSHSRFSDGAYAVTASQSGDTSPPATLYSLQPDSYGSVPDALVIVTSHPVKKAGGPGSRPSGTA